MDSFHLSFRLHLFGWLYLLFYYLLGGLLKIMDLGQMFSWPLGLLPKETCPWGVPLNEIL